MNIKTINLVCFSPTGTSRSILNAIQQGLNAEHVGITDITQKSERQTPLQASKDDLVVFAMPVYSGRLPVVAEQWLHSMVLDNTPAVCVVVYGNREYEDALLELKDIVQQRGGIPVAGATFIGEHSFSTENTPIAVARPNSADLHQAQAFGRKAYDALNSYSSTAEISALNVPGNTPYRERGNGTSIDFISISDDCTECGQCASVCPVEAIPVATPKYTDLENCIHCCACIKACPEHARIMKEGMLLDISKKLSVACREPKEATFFFA